MTGLHRPILALATWLATPNGFLWTTGAVGMGVGAGFALAWSDKYVLALNLALSIAALLIAGIILVAGARDTAALHAKADEIIRALPQADDRLRGIERRED